MQLAFVLGRTPRLAQREVEATATILPFQWSTTSVQGSILRLKPDLTSVEGKESYAHFLDFKDSAVKTKILELQRRLGGTLRILYLHKQCVKAEIPAELTKMVEAAQYESTGKLTLGISVWGGGVQPFHVVKGVKKELQKMGRSVRFVIPRVGSSLSTAQVVHNDLAFFPSEGKGMELICIAEKESWWIGCTLTIQDIESYTLRDFSIPAPDPVSGMLSPKLAQMMLNCAVGGSNDAVYDPFCGNGRLVLEGWYMGIKSYGSDIVSQKVTAARKNLAWLAQKFQLSLPQPEELIWEADATLPASRDLAITKLKGQPWRLVGEPYLGKPLRHPLAPNEVEPWLKELYPLYDRFFSVWAECSAKDRPRSMLVVIPRAKVTNGQEAALYDLLVDRLEELRYSSEVLFCYDRPDSLVRRDLVAISYTE